MKKGCDRFGWALGCFIFSTALICCSLMVFFIHPESPWNEHKTTIHCNKTTVADYTYNSSCPSLDGTPGPCEICYFSIAETMEIFTTARFVSFAVRTRHRSGPHSCSFLPLRIPG